MSEIDNLINDIFSKYREKDIGPFPYESIREFDWCTKYRFMEAYDLSNYPDFYDSFSLYDDLRRMLLDVIKVYELKDRE